MDGYIRVSRRLGREGPGYISPTVQREAIQRWADYQQVEMAAWHVDEDESGGTQNRPALRAAIDRALIGETDGIVSWKIDRFSRFTEGGLRDLRALEDAGARLAFVTEDIDTGGPMGRFVYTVMLAMSEYLLESLKAGWVVAKTRAVQRGAHIGPTPFGYLRADDGTLLADAERGPTVTDAFTAAAQGGLHAATRLLEARAPERTWTTYTTRRFLANRTYLGEVRYGDHLAQTEAHEPLVSRAIFEAAQYEPTGARRPRGDFPLSGVATCGTCGATMVGGRGGGDNRRMYRCSARCAQPAVVSADLLEGHIVGVVQAQFDRRPGFRIGTNSPDIGHAERALLEAEAELDEFAADTTARKLLGHRYHAALGQRAAVLDEAREALRTALAASEHARPMLAPEAWDTLEPAGLAEVLRAGLESVIVTRGRRPISERVAVVPKGLDRDAQLGPEDA